MQGQKVSLHPLRLEDKAILFKWINDRELVHFNATYKPVSELEHDEWFKRITQREDVFFFIIKENEKDITIGSCQLHNLHWIHRSAELQTRIGDHKYRNKGYGTEAIELLLKFGFEDLNLHRIYLHVLKDNDRARKVYLKTGFTVEGELCEAAFINGKYLDVHLMSILRDTYKKRVSEGKNVES
jgi:RimJ/RimL family protein N-acetyltransferase